MSQPNDKDIRNFLVAGAMYTKYPVSLRVQALGEQLLRNAASLMVKQYLKED